VLHAIPCTIRSTVLAYCAENLDTLTPLDQSEILRNGNKRKRAVLLSVRVRVDQFRLHSPHRTGHEGRLDHGKHNILWLRNQGLWTDFETLT